jgi:hypothetical protein
MLSVRPIHANSRCILGFGGREVSALSNRSSFDPQESGASDASADESYPG